MDKTVRANIIMGDVSKAVSRMLASGRVDKDLLMDKDGKVISKDNLSYTSAGKAVLRQYKGVMAPSYKKSMFAQDKGITIHHHLFEIRYTVQQMEADHFSIPADISHKVHTQNLMKHKRKDLVKAAECSAVGKESEHKQVIEIKSCIANARQLYQKDISMRMGLLDADGDDVEKLPDVIAIPALLNPLMVKKT